MSAFFIGLALVVYTALGRSASEPTTASTVAPPPKPLTAVTLDDGQRVTGEVFYRDGDPRPWIRVRGASTVLVRPLPAERIVAVETLAPRTATPEPPREAVPRLPEQPTDAELAQRLLFD
ncbi:MAG: hypothetical protein AAF589_07325 [Planctomycetota bacterium]